MRLFLYKSHTRVLLISHICICEPRPSLHGPSSATRQQRLSRHQEQRKRKLLRASKGEDMARIEGIDEIALQRCNTRLARLFTPHYRWYCSTRTVLYSITVLRKRIEYCTSSVHRSEVFSKFRNRPHPTVRKFLIYKLYIRSTIALLPAT